MRAVVPEALRKKLLPRRSIPGSARPANAVKAVRAIGTIYRQARGTQWKGIFEAGLASTKDTSLLESRKIAHALLSRSDAAGIAAASLEALGVAQRVVLHVSPAECLSPAIVAARSLGDAVEACARACDLDTVHDGRAGVLVVPSSGRSRGWRTSWGVPLRHLVCAASDAEYAAARARADTLRVGASTHRRAFLAFVFPDEPWANLDLATALEPHGESRDLGFLLGAATDPALIRGWRDAHHAATVATYALDLASALPAAHGIPLLAETIPALLARPSYGPVLKTPPRELAQAIGCYDTPEAAAALAPYAANAILGPQVLAWFAEHPHHGAALEAEARGKDKLVATASRVLGKRAERPVPIADASEIPTILRDAPWRSSRAAKPREVVTVDDVPFQGLELERVALVRPPPDAQIAGPVREMTETELEAWRASVQKGRGTADCQYSGRGYARVPDDEGLRAWNESSGFLTEPLAWVARHGCAAIPGFVNGRRDWIQWLEYEESDEYLHAALSLISPRVAPAIAAVAARRKRHRRAAHAWLLEHVEVAALGLVRDAVSPARDARANAEAALLWLARRGHEATLRRAADRYGGEVSRAIDALLARDPLALGISPPKRPPFLRLAELPTAVVKSGGALDGAAMSALVELLQVVSPDEAYPGIEQVRETCDAASLGALALELLEQWVIGDAPGRHEWMLFATIHFRSERGTRRVAELAREWARKNHAKAERACAALAAEGSDLALMHLAHIAETTRFAGLRETAGGLLREAASARGLTEDELGDRTVPDLGLGADGTRVLSYGARAFVIAPDPSLRLIARERNDNGLGPPATVLPRPSASDDAVAAKSAREAFDRLKKDLQAIGARQVRRLEQAMVKGRVWSVADFEALVASHPLLGHLARALVWEIVAPRGEARAFRIAEDGSYADAADASLPLPAGAAIRVAHPARSPGLPTAWGGIFSDYEVVQPFEQLGRAVHAIAGGGATDLPGAAGKKVAARKLLGVMESRGWERDDRGHITAWLRSVVSADGAPLRVRWPITPGIALDDTLRHAPDVTMEALVVERGAGGAGVRVALAALDPVSYSELARDVEAVRAL